MHFREKSIIKLKRISFVHVHITRKITVLSRILKLIPYSQNSRTVRISANYRGNRVLAVEKAPNSGK